jgi:mRNA-degrading endonuclease RelE of RelBE toxin-antitoxin system
VSVSELINDAVRFRLAEDAVDLEAFRTRAKEAASPFELARDPRPHGCEKLSGAEKYRVRRGDHRILYQIDDSAKLVTVVKVGNRREIHR